MIQKIKKHLMIISTAALLMVPALVPASAAAVTQSDINSSVCGGTDLSLSGSGNCGSGTTSNLDTFLQWAVNIFSAIVGIIAVVMIIVGGLKYITSGGESSKVGSAKNTLLYAIIGLIVVALAQVIVHFVIAKTSTSLGGGL
ncbi:MAG TPA: pilin [Candidatus Saccharimonadales bacterium]|nr:pilin [Candidatus Saccharimonadales bacterium]